MNKAYSKGFSEYTSENGGRVALLFLLFIIAIYQFCTIGFTGFALVCAIPVIALLAILAFRYSMYAFWTLFVINYTVMFLNRYQYMPIPSSVPNEMLEILLLAIAIIEMKDLHFGRLCNTMFVALAAWCAFCTLEVLNDTCKLGINIEAWYAGARLMAFQLMYAFLVCTIYISTPQKFKLFLKVWAILSIFAAFWAWKQQKFGFTATEKVWLEYAGRTHLVNGITRYFSIFSDAANFGCNMAASAVTFFIVAITTKLRKERIFFLIAALSCTWAMFSSGTRTAIFCMIAGFMVYIFLSKSFKIAIPVSIVFALFIAFLAFTNIGNSNNMIRRMRSAFNRNDTSANARHINQESMKKYMNEAPWGIGIGNGYENVPASNKFRKLSTIPPDSEYVFIWIHTGIIGITTFVITTVAMLFGACWIVFFRIKSKSLQGAGAGICCAFVSIQLGGYGNQILMQYPNVLIFYGSLALVYIMPYIETEWNEHEAKLLAEQEERKRMKLEKKRASRV